MAAKGTAPMGAQPEGAMPPKDFASALESMPEEVAAPPEGMSEGSDLDAEQQGLAEEMGFSPEEASALKRFVESCKSKAY